MALKLRTSNVFTQLKRQSGITVVTATTSCVAVLAPRFKRRYWIRSKASPCGICGGHEVLGYIFVELFGFGTFRTIIEVFSLQFHKYTHSIRLCIYL